MPDYKLSLVFNEYSRGIIDPWKSKKLPYEGAEAKIMNVFLQNSLNLVIFEGPNIMTQKS